MLSSGTFFYIVQRWRKRDDGAIVAFHVEEPSSILERCGTLTHYVKLSCTLCGGIESKMMTKCVLCGLPCCGILLGVKWNYFIRDEPCTVCDLLLWYTALWKPT